MIVEFVIGLVLAPILCVLFTYAKHIIALRHYSPGPFPFPMIGNLNLLNKDNFLKNLEHLPNKYGDIFSVSFGHKRAILISEISIAKDALIKKGDKVAGRLELNDVFNIIYKNSKGLACSEGEKWKTLRKLCHSSLQMYGYGMERMESKIVKESEVLRDYFFSLQGEAVDPKMALGLAFANVICTLMFGERYNHNDLEFMDIMKYQSLMLQLYGSKELVMYFPFLKVLPIFESVTLAHEVVALRNPILMQKIHEHRESADPEHLRDFLDALLKFSRELKETTSEDITDYDLLTIVDDLIAAGVDSGLNSFGFAVRYLVHYPEYQDLIFQEMSNVLGTGVYPSLKDRCRLPLLDATVMEVFRLSSVAMIGLTHKSLEDVSIGGYDIKKDTLILFNIWRINHDSRYWEKPYEFNPRRWIADDGSVASAVKQSFLAFGAGRRNCLGEVLAKAQMFLLLGRLLIDFNLKVQSGDALPSLEPDVTMLLLPKPCSLCFVPRHS